MAHTELVRVVTSRSPTTRVQRIREAFRSYWKGPYNLATITAGLFGDSPPSSTGVQVSEETALTYAPVWACVYAISSDEAALPLIHYQRLPNGGKRRYTESKLYRLLHDEPNPEMSSMTMRETMTAHMLTWGNAYAEIERDQAGRPLYLWPLTPGRVQPVRTRTGDLAYRVDGVSGVVIPAADMIHVPGLGFDGVCGYSVIAKARESMGLGLATERFGGTFFGNGATFGGVISLGPGEQLTEAAEKNFREKVEARHQGVDRAHKFLLLGNQAKYERLGIPPEDAQFLETRTFQIEDQCRWFRMPPHKIQHLLRSTNNNIEHQGIEYYTDCLSKWLKRWEQELNRKLIPPSERRIQFIEHVIEGAMRGDLPSRYAAYAIGRQWGWLSPNDVREKENLNPLEKGGDIYLVPMNMAPADRLHEIIDKQVAPEPVPVVTPPPGGDGTPPPDTQKLREDLAAAQQRAEELLTRAVAAETAVHGSREARAASEVEIQQARQAAIDAAGDVARLQAVLLVATEHEAAARAEREALAATFAQASTETAARLAAETARALTAETALTAAQAAADAARATVLERETARDEALARIVTLEAQLEATVPAGELADRQAALTTVRAELVERTAAVEIARADMAAAAASLLAETTARAAADAFATEAAERHAETSRHFLAATTAKDVAEQAAVVLSLKLGDAERLVAAEAAARTEAEAAGAAQHAAELQRMTAVVGAHRGLIADAMGRMIRRETEKARRAQATPEKLRHWIETFYPVHDDICRAALLPAIRAHLAWQQSTDDPTVVTQALVKTHIEASIRDLRLVLDSDPEDVPMTLETTLRHWELERAEALADVILTEAIGQVTRGGR